MKQPYRPGPELPARGSAFGRFALVIVTPSLVSAVIAGTLWARLRFGWELGGTCVGLAIYLLIVVGTIACMLDVEPIGKGFKVLPIAAVWPAALVVIGIALAAYGFAMKVCVPALKGMGRLGHWIRNGDPDPVPQPAQEEDDDA